MTYANDASPERLERPRQLDKLDPEQLVSVVLHLGMELSVLQERLATHEALLEQAGVVSRDAIERFQPDDDDASERLERRNALIAALIERLRSD